MSLGEGDCGMVLIFVQQRPVHLPPGDQKGSFSVWDPCTLPLDLGFADRALAIRWQGLVLSPAVPASSK